MIEITGFIFFDCDIRHAHAYDSAPQFVSRAFAITGNLLAADPSHSNEP